MKYRRWTLEETELLRQLRQTKGNLEIANIMQRDPETISFHCVVNRIPPAISYLKRICALWRIKTARAEKRKPATRLIVGYSGFERNVHASGVVSETYMKIAN